MRFYPISLILILTTLTACTASDVRESVGLTRTAPDEFVVVSRPPLSVPPDFELRPPRPGAQRAAESTELQAKKLILKDGEQQSQTLEELVPAPKNVETAIDPVITSDAKTSAESNILSKLGTDKADPDIRTKLGTDAVTPRDTSDAKSLYEKLIKADGEEPVVDAKQEAARIRSNKEAGKPVNEGDVPEAESSKKSVIDRIF
jgi:hypothetical protein